MRLNRLFAIDVQLMLIITSLLYIAAIPRAISEPYEMVIESFLFVVTGFTSILIYRAGAAWIFLFFFILTVFYNPLFLILHDIDNSLVLDTCVALICFVIALFWRRLLSIHTSV